VSKTCSVIAVVAATKSPLLTVTTVVTTTAVAVAMEAVEATVAKATSSRAPTAHTGSLTTPIRRWSLRRWPVTEAVAAWIASDAEGATRDSCFWKAHEPGRTLLVSIASSGAASRHLLLAQVARR
jgi:hypothetical protein